MTTIYRYELTDAINDIELPVGSNVLNVGIAKEYNNTEIISLWAKVNTDNWTETRRFLVFGTGADMTSLSNFETKYIGTVQCKNMYAFHVFEVNNSTNI